MLIINYIYKKIFISSYVILTSTLLVFFIFSLIGNLNEDYSFFTIINISIFNSLQTLIYIPSIIFSLILYLSWYFLNIKNELFIIRQYFSKKKIIFFLSFVFALISFIEINKFEIIENIELSKKIMINNDKDKLKIFISENSNFEEYFFFKSSDSIKNGIEEFNYFKIINEDIKDALYSINLEIFDDSIKINDYYELKDNLIFHNSLDKFIEFEKLSQSLNNNKLVSKKFNNNLFNPLSIHKFAHYLFLYVLIICLVYKSFSYRNLNSLIYYSIVSFLFIIYSYFLFKVNLFDYRFPFLILGNLIIMIMILKNIFYE